MVPYTAWCQAPLSDYTPTQRELSASRPAFEVIRSEPTCLSTIKGLFSRCCGLNAVAPERSIAAEEVRVLQGPEEQTAIPASLIPPPRSPITPKRGWNVASLELGPKLGQGGHGCVFSVRSKELDRQAAFKQVPYYPATRRSLEREVIYAPLIDYPFIVKVISVEQVFSKITTAFPEGHCIVMELIEGPSLAACMTQRKSGSQAFLKLDIQRIAAELVSAISYLHMEIRLIHRDIKGENVLLGMDGHVKLVDLSLLRPIDDESSGPWTPCGTQGLLMKKI